MLSRATGSWRRLTGLLAVTGMAVMLFGAGVEPAWAVGPKVIKATRYSGVKKVANMRVDNPYQRDLSFGAVNRKLGKPGRLRARGGVCTTVYGAGLTLLFTTFGGYRSCRDTLLQFATVWKRSWRVKVGGRTYRVGMPKRRTPARNKRPIRYFGYQVASMPAFGRRIGTVFLRFNKRDRVSSIYLWIGGAGD